MQCSQYALNYPTPRGAFVKDFCTKCFRYNKGFECHHLHVANGHGCVVVSCHHDIIGAESTHMKFEELSGKL